MINELKQAILEIFSFKDILKNVVDASINSPSIYLDKVFPIYQQMVELVNSLTPFTLNDVQDFLNVALDEFSDRPFFPVLGGLFVSALINNVLRSEQHIEVDLRDLCYEVIEHSTKGATVGGEEYGEVNFSLDFLGYLQPPNTGLKLIGPVGDYAGALMRENAILVIQGYHGNYLGHGKHETAEIAVEEP